MAGIMPHFKVVGFATFHQAPVWPRAPKGCGALSAGAVGWDAP